MGLRLVNGISSCFLGFSKLLVHMNGCYCGVVEDPKFIILQGLID